MIAEWVRTARVDAGLSGADLGVRLALELGSDRGHTKANISHWENGKHSPSLEQLIAIVHITGRALPPQILARMGAIGSPLEGAGIGAVAVAPVVPQPPPWMDAEAYELLNFYFALDKRGREVAMLVMRGAAGANSSGAASNDG